MNILVLGGTGMAGHVCVDYLTEVGHAVQWTVRPKTYFGSSGLPLEASDETHVVNVIERTRPDVVINAVGLLNHQATANVEQAICVNSLLPHWLAKYGRVYGYRVFHISTDCVFSGKRGGYSEVDEKDGTTVYAKTKSLGELDDKTNLTVRTSIIGPELKRCGIGLFDWFMHQSGSVPGYEDVYWNGVTTLQLAKMMERLLYVDISGLVHLIGPSRISKFNLLQQIGDTFQLGDVEVYADELAKSDKTLVSTRSDFAPYVPSYPVMLEQLRDWMLRYKDKYEQFYTL